MSDAREKLTFAADLPIEQGLELYRRVAAQCAWAKVGLSLFVEHGPEAVRAFQALGAQVFLDLKLHDIPNTVELATARAASLGVGLLTVHAQGGRAMLEAARRAAGATRLLAVTVLTSMSDGDLRETGVPEPASAHALRLGELAKLSGLTGMVCSPREAAVLRGALGPEFFLCTPGIRPAGADRQDQSRSEAPEAAIRAGASLLVVGRPIYAAEHPEAAARAIHAEVERALAAGTG